MLDIDTKRRIDTARDILVGKVPDPKSQVEQITIALIYKFMDDMDAEAEELGGKRKFFAGDFARYGWTKLMRSGLGGHETLALYAEAITKMPENPGIPLLFRDIFKNAFLPYRDPEILKVFLKVIDEFEYDHSDGAGTVDDLLVALDLCHYFLLHVQRRKRNLNLAYSSGICAGKGPTNASDCLHERSVEFVGNEKRFQIPGQHIVT